MSKKPKRKVEIRVRQRGGYGVWYACLKMRVSPHDWIDRVGLGYHSKASAIRSAKQFLSDYGLDGDIVT